LTIAFLLIDCLALELQGFILRYLHKSTTTTMFHSRKLAILQSLDAMDQKQMDEVLGYIKGILSQTPVSTDYQTFKREALKEIQQALRKEKKGLRLTV
jgi:hypothetical protein